MADYIKKIQDEAAQMKLREADEERERQLHEAANPVVPDAAPVSSTSSASWQQPKPAAFSAPISADDFNDNGDDAWGDDLDDLTSPTTTTTSTPIPSTTTSASWSTPAPSTFSSSARQAPLAPKPVHVTPPKPLQPAASKDDFFGDWGAPSSTGSSASRTGSGSLSLQKPSASTGFSSASASPIKPAEPKKSLQERRSEAKAKREPLGAMKLQNKPKGGDNWDWDM